MVVPSHRSSISTLLMRAGLPDFPVDEYGFPQPGPVIRHFREQMKYTNPDDNSEKKWRQTDLALRLGVSEVTVRLMETKNNSLDSIARRRVLADILKIPPVLLGIGSFSELQDYLVQHHANPISAPAIGKGKSVENETIKLYQDAFIVYSSMHSTSTAQDSIFEVERWIERIQIDSAHTNSTQQNALHRTLWDFHALSSKIYADDLGDWNNAFIHLNMSMELANQLNSDDLRTASLYRSGQIRFAQRNFYLAKSDLDGAVQHAKNASPYLKGAVYAAAGLAHALVDKDEAGRKYTMSLFDTAGKYITTGSQGTDEHVIVFNTGKYLTERADMLIILGRPGKALEVLDDAMDVTNPSETRRMAYIDILRAEAFTRLKTPQYDTATNLLSSAFATSSSIKSGYNVGYINRLYADLSKSTYGKSLEVADLGLALRNWKK